MTRSSQAPSFYGSVGCIIAIVYRQYVSLSVFHFYGVNHGVTSVGVCGLGDSTTGQWTSSIIGRQYTQSEILTAEAPCMHALVDRQTDTHTRTHTHTHMQHKHACIQAHTHAHTHTHTHTHTQQYRLRLQDFQEMTRT